MSTHVLARGASNLIRRSSTPAPRSERAARERTHPLPAGRSTAAYTPPPTARTHDPRLAFPACRREHLARRRGSRATIQARTLARMHIPTASHSVPRPPLPTRAPVDQARLADVGALYDVGSPPRLAATRMSTSGGISRSSITSRRPP
ncbi:hypothetical protein C8J57DRAFT_1528236 [Mycena rebaudengoi]|nr:hypothetical protein C8J57DRAFT_1528236 [Mycena rebaudengoi]